MSRTQYYCAASLDGFIASADDTIDWLMGYEGSYGGADAEPADGSYDRFYDDVGALVMGSVTYQFVLDLGRGWMYGGKPVWVLSSRSLPLPEGDDVDVRMVQADVRSLHAEMLEAAGERNLWVVGGGNVASQYAEAGLLDEVIVTVVPVVLGEGKPLFDHAVSGAPMQLAGARPLDSGMVELWYELRRDG